MYIVHRGNSQSREYLWKLYRTDFGYCLTQWFWIKLPNDLSRKGKISHGLYQKWVVPLIKCNIHFCLSKIFKAKITIHSPVFQTSLGYVAFSPESMRWSPSAECSAGIPQVYGGQIAMTDVFKIAWLTTWWPLRLRGPPRSRKKVAPSPTVEKGRNPAN